MNATNGCMVYTCKMQWFLYFLYYVQAAQPVWGAKVQASFVTANTILMTYQFTGDLYIYVHETCHLEYDNNNYCWCSINTIDACSHLVWIGWHLVLSVAIPAAGIGVVVAPWHGHHAQHVPAFWEDCSTVTVGGSGKCWEGCFIPSVYHYLRWSLPHCHILK